MSALRSDAFSLNSYRALLSGFSDRGYAARGFAEADASERHLIVRHDLDMSLDAALPVAEIESDLGVRSTYFVLLRTEMYNPWSRDGRHALARLGELGHNIGLHFDASVYRADGAFHAGPDDAGLDDACAAECDALERITGAPVSMVSFHRPVKRLQGLDRPVGGRPHAYQPRWFNEMGYCSDSRGAWNYGHPFDHPAVTAGRALQLLTHPIWWATSGADPAAKLQRFVSDRDEKFRAELAANCDSFNAESTERK